METPERTELTDLVQKIFGNSIQPSKSIQIALDLEEIPGTDKDKQEVLVGFLTDFMFSGIKYLYGEVEPIAILGDQEKCKTVVGYLHSIGWNPIVESGIDPETNKIVSYRVTFSQLS